MSNKMHEDKISYTPDLPERASFARSFYLVGSSPSPCACSRVPEDFFVRNITHPPDVSGCNWALSLFQLSYNKISSNQFYQSNQCSFLPRPSERLSRVRFTQHPLQSIKILLVRVHRKGFDSGAELGIVKQHLKHHMRLPVSNCRKSHLNTEQRLRKPIPREKGVGFYSVKHRMVLIVALVWPVHRKAPMPARPQVVLMEGIGKTHWPPPCLQQFGVCPSVKHKLLRVVKRAGAHYL
jgi:hypothetical protein